jgi:hypothetical protein
VAMNVCGKKLKISTKNAMGNVNILMIPAMDNVIEMILKYVETYALQLMIV